jgi:Thymidylate synthase
VEYLPLTGRRSLSMAMYQRSADLFLGVPFNLASYATLLHMIAISLDYDVGKLILNLGDTHIYTNHFVQVTEQLSRSPERLPELGFAYAATQRAHADIAEGNYAEVLQNFMAEDFVLANYEPQPAIPAPMAV